LNLHGRGFRAHRFDDFTTERFDRARACSAVVRISWRERRWQSINNRIKTNACCSARFINARYKKITRVKGRARALLRVRRALRIRSHHDL
jgi:hypothetical protein